MANYRRATPAPNQIIGRENRVNTEFGSKAMEGADIGGATGATIGGLIGAIAAIGTSVVIPGWGLEVSGPLVAALLGAGAGGVAGGLLGALVGSVIPGKRAE